MNCENVEKLISAYIDRELSSDLEPKVRYHLAYCERCFRTYAEMQKTKELLSSLKSHALPDAFWTETRAKFRNQMSTSASRPGSSLPRLWTALAAAACLLLTASLVTLAPNSSPDMSYLASPSGGQAPSASLSNRAQTPVTPARQSASLMRWSSSPSYEQSAELVRSQSQSKVQAAAFEDPFGGLSVYDFSRVLKVDGFDLPAGGANASAEPQEDTDDIIVPPGSKQKTKAYYGSPTLVPAGWSGGK